MSVTTIGRWSLAFWLEALLLACAAMMFGWLTVSLSHFLMFGIVASLLFVLGSVVFHEGSRSPLLHFLLYPVVGGVGLLVYVTFDSWVIALLGAGLFFWRIHSVASEGINHANLLRRFVLGFMLCLIQFTVAGLYGTAVHAEMFDPAIYYWMLGLILGSYLLTSLVEYVTRAETVTTRLPASIRLKLGGQVLAAHSLLALSYMLVAAAILGLLAFLWAWLKCPLGSGLYWLVKPILEQLAAWSEALAGTLGKDQRVHDLLENQGAGADQGYVPVETGEPLISLLEPYLIAALSLVVLIVLARAIWKRRFQKASQAKEAASTEASTVWSPLGSAAKEDPRPLWDVREWFNKAPGPADDPVRYAYYQFLQHTTSLGYPIYRYETSQEYFRRLQQQIRDSAFVQLAATITNSYERYRYREQTPTPEELAAMQQAVKALRDTPKSDAREHVAPL